MRHFLQAEGRGFKSNRGSEKAENISGLFNADNSMIHTAFALFS